MTFSTILFCGAILVFGLATRLPANPLPMTDPVTTIDVWPGLAPGEATASIGTSVTDTTGQFGTITKVSDITRPRIFFYPAPGPKRPRPTVMVFPGGGYYLLATDIEGTEIAQWLNTLGYNAAVLHYRVPDAGVPSPARREPAWQDARQAMSDLRSHASDLGIAPHSLGVMGFSAGGHLAARCACLPSEADGRPDFALLIYPAYLWDKAANAPMPEVAPRAGMPPMFLMQTRDDGFFDAEDYAGALIKAGVQTKTAIYPTGGHGYGLRLPSNLPAHRWPEEAASWLRELHPK